MLVSLSIIRSQEEKSTIFGAINVFRLEIFSFVLKYLQYRVFVIAYSGHLRCRAKVIYNSRSEGELSAFTVITNEGNLGTSWASSKYRLATRPANWDFPGLPDMYKYVKQLSLVFFSHLSFCVIWTTSRSRSARSCEGFGRRKQKEEIYLCNWSSRTRRCSISFSSFLRSSIFAT